MRSWRTTIRSSSLICGRGCVDIVATPAVEKTWRRLDRAAGSFHGLFNAHCRLGFPFLRTLLPEASYLGHLLTIVLCASTQWN